MARESNIGENIKKLRIKAGLSQEDFAKKSGVKYTTLTKIEIGVILLKAIGFDFSKNRQGT
jgi:transcriptional regulator with XRE-family HTH domain